MSEIPASLVMELRKRTQAGMMECKNALSEAAGDIDKAVDAMRKSGQAKADKKAGRIAAEGLIVITLSADKTKASILEINCETDFVARDENFLAFTNEVGNIALNNQVNDAETLIAMKSESQNDLSIDEVRKNLIVKIGENIKVRRIQFFEGANPLGVYVHGGRIGVVTQLDTANEDLAKDIAMHVAASNPLVIQPEEIAEDVIEKEREIFLAQIEKEGKPKDIAEKILVGKLAKFTKEQSLVGQNFVKDPDTTVGKLLQDNSANVINFVRFEVGEGIEKKEEDFAKEVMEQMQASE